MALGPAVGWLGEGVLAIRRRNPAVVQHIYNLLEPHPGKAIQDAARDAKTDTMFLIRVPHSSGMLEGKYTADTVFPPNDHRNHRPRSWLLNGVKKVEQLLRSSNAGARARWGRRPSSGCWPMTGWPRYCRTSTTRSNSGNLREATEKPPLTAGGDGENFHLGGGEFWPGTGRVEI